MKPIAAGGMTVFPVSIDADFCTEQRLHHLRKNALFDIMIYSTHLCVHGDAESAVSTQFEKIREQAFTAHTD
jgi:hypothetical protein